MIITGYFMRCSNDYQQDDIKGFYYDIQSVAMNIWQDDYRRFYEVRQ